MTRMKIGLVVGLGLVAAFLAHYTLVARSRDLIPTGMVTTNNVIVSPQVAGEVSRLLVNEMCTLSVLGR